MPFRDLSSRLVEVRDRISAAVRRGGHGQSVTIVAVTKTHAADAVSAAVAAGVRDVGENKVQEALNKMSVSDVDANWHLIGHLQRNKVKHLSSFHLFHALDSSRLADAVNSSAVQQGIRVSALMQVNIAGEETKGGFSPAEVEAEAERLRSMTGITLRGVMTMAPLDAGEQVLRQVFAGARSARDTLVGCGHDAHQLSMGMSDDYEMAVEEGATLVRLGTVLFGERPK